MNDGAEVHEFVPLRIKNKNDKLKALLRLPEKKANKKIEVLDHVILGRATQERPKDYMSLRELGYFAGC